MNCRLPSMDTRLLRRKAGVIVPTLVQELCGTIRSSAPNQDGKRIDNLPKIVLRLLESDREHTSCLLPNWNLPLVFFPFIDRIYCLGLAGPLSHGTTSPSPGNGQFLLRKSWSSRVVFGIA